MTEPKLDGILETVLYVEDLARACAFYETILRLRVIHADQRMRAFDVNGRGTLLLFVRGASLQPVQTPAGTIPPHDGEGPVHIAFSIAEAELGAWRLRLSQHGVAIEGEASWPRGGRSLYFRDPDAHLLELATPGLWPGY
ncbi:MAG: glyoxalase [Rhizobiales bacterium 65-9]|nr:VOC family protein [Hyphomicrobiales bacterium]OJY32466.1 MAG: glyoxalase [Rhizobiales bacterium 65-9]